MSISAIDMKQRSPVSTSTGKDTLVGSLEGHQIRRLALATALLSWGGILFLLG